MLCILERRLLVTLIYMYIIMQDFYLDLVEDDRKITPRDYLELALRPVQGSGKDIVAKNEVCVARFLLAVKKG